MKPEELSLHQNIQLLDVRLSDDFEAAHIAHAASNCVFEVAFLNRLAESAPDKSATTVVYGADAISQEAAMAAEKLRRAGYQRVEILEGGIAAARAAGVALVSGKILPSLPAPPHGDFEIDLQESRLEWLGRNLLNKHWGTVALDSGTLTFDNGRLIGGTITIDLLTMKCTDLADSDVHDVLIDHLHSDDFLDTDNHPKAKLVLESAREIDGSTHGDLNVEIDARLTLKGQTHPVKIKAAAGTTEQGAPAAQAAFSLDRTRWGILYGSGKFFHRLAGHLVNDLVEFQARIVTIPNK